MKSATNLDMQWKAAKNRTLQQFKQARVPESFHKGFLNDIDKRDNLVQRFLTRIEEIDNDRKLSAEGKQDARAQAQQESKDEAGKIAAQKKFDEFIQQDLNAMASATAKRLQASDEKRHLFAKDVFGRLEQIRQRHAEQAKERMKAGELVSDEEFNLDAARVEIEGVIKSDHPDRQLIMAVEAKAGAEQ